MEEFDLNKECQNLTANGSGISTSSTDYCNGRVTTPPLPEGCVPLSHQVAGHMYGKGATKAGLLQDGKGIVLKPVQNASRGTKELTFYHDITRPDQTNPVLASLRPYVPHFYGTFTSSEEPPMMYIRIKDVTTRFRMPCIMDVKVGCKSYEDGVPMRKVELAKQKYPNLEKIGFQILGMRVYHPATGEFECQDKFYGRGLRGDNVIEGFARYLNVVDGIRIDVIPEFLKQMRRIEQWFANQNELHFYSSSLLFVYEGAISTSPKPELALEPDYMLNNIQPNFVSYSDLKRSGPKPAHLPPSKGVPSLPNSGSTEGSLRTGSLSEENEYINRLPTYEESIAAKLGQGGSVCPPPKVVTGTAGAKSNLNAPPLLDINGRLTVSQLRERQKNHPPSNKPADCPSTEPHDQIAVSDASSSSSSQKPNQTTASPPPLSVNLNNNEDSQSQLADIKMIDFTHVVGADGIDESYLFGLRNVMHYFEILNNVYGKKN